MTPPNDQLPVLTCGQVASGSLPERYVSSRLSEPEREAYENHYFGCDVCFSELETLRLTRQALQKSASAIRAEPLPRKAPSGFRWILWIAAPIAAALALAIGFWPRTPPAPVTPVARVQSPSAAKPLAELAQFEPPRFLPSLLRGAEEQNLFALGMERYTRHDYAAAIPYLRKAAAGSTQAEAARFFLASCELLTSNPDAAIVDFRGVLSNANSVFTAETHYSLAKAFLQKGDTAAARRELQRTIDLQSDFASQASELLARLDAMY
jgi:tetratricopeptide (TPR) repeat protein